MKNANLAGKSFVLLLILLGGMAILAYFYSTAGGKLPLAEKPYKVTAILTDPQQVLKHADVRSAGVRVGEVGVIENGDDGRTRMELEIKRAYAPIYRDAKVLVRQKTLVGENYIDLTIGTVKAGQVQDGGRLAAAAQKEAVPIDKVLNTLNPETRKNVSRNLQSLGGATKSRGQDLNELFDRVAPLSEDGSALLDVLNKQRGQIARLVANTGVVMGAISSRTNDLQSLVRSAKTTAEAVAARDAAVERTFESIPPTLKQARTTVAKLRTFSRDATPVVDDVRTSLQRLRPVLTKLRPTAARARRLTNALPALFTSVDPALTTLPGFADSGTAAVPRLEGMLRELNPFLAYASPYKNEVTGFIQNWSSGYTFDSTGVTARCTCPVGVNSFANFPGESRKLLAPLLDTGPARALTHEEENHYRKPGGLVDPSSPASNYKVVERDNTPNAVVR